ncbi:MAG: PD40 domain-containing protein [Steroidobacter sp.]|nr:PD40 domain-containing protein [Steroidobacter sp.]
MAADWDIANTGQPYKDVEFTVTEGTWMGVDVSPDGKTLVFDLLGDIYSLPVTGGDATLLHGGPATQTAMSFSADGKQLLYLSDITGVSNVWVSNVDGSSPRQITHEKVDILASPTWGPNGRTVAVTHISNVQAEMYTSDIRLFDVAGGAGRVLVDRPKNQRDVQEARFSSDGRYLYYTERLNDPFTYIDANHINFAIKRRNLSTGEAESLLQGFGSATTPQISPDGKQVAFVRRVKTKTVLFVYDTETGRQRPVFDDLDRDAQAENWLQTGYFPRFDWFPDNRHVAIWGKGKLLRVDTGVDAQAGHAATEIPFRVLAKHRVTEPLRVSNDLAPDKFPVRIVRQLAPAADGNSLVFNSLGALWSKPLPNGTPVRLTKGDAFEYEPMYSRDGKQLTFVEWHDERGGALRISAAGGRGAKTLVKSRGVVRQPSISPDGKRVVYRIQTGDKNLGGYGAKAGIYWVDIASGQSHRVADDGETPMFSPDGKRIYFTVTKRDSEVSTQLHSVNIEGFDQRLHAYTPNSDVLDVVVSPDLRWIAFRELQQYYVVPYLETGTPMLVTATNKAMPVAALTELGGQALAWSVDSKTLHWVLGPSLYRVDVAAMFANGASPPKSYATLGLEVASDVPSGTLALTNGRVITMQGDQIIERGTVVVTGNRIVAVGETGAVAIPAGAKVIDVAGKTVMPGLIDMHGHIECCSGGEGLLPQKQAGRYAALAFGVTTNFDPYSSEVNSYESGETDRAGITVSPRWIGSGHVIYGRSKTPSAKYVPISNYDDARVVMERKRALGGIVIKSYKQPSRSQRQQLVKAGRDFNVMVDIEGDGYYNIINSYLDGHTNVEHSISVANYYDDVVQLMGRGGVANTPTLVVLFGELYGENYMYQNTRAWEDPKIRRFVQKTISHYSPLGLRGSAPPHVRGMTGIHAAEEVYEIGIHSVARSIKKLDEAGVRVNVGSHGQVPGLAMHWEMQLLAQGGMSNHHILRAATLNGATTLGLEKQIGSLAVGKLADLIVMDANPLDNVANANSVRYTMLNGRLYDSLTLDEVGNHARPRSKFYWELADYKGIDWNEAWAEP